MRSRPFFFRGRRAPGCSSGFTLVEVLVALLIVASAGSAILGKTRALLDYNRRLNSRQEEASQLLNRAALLPLSATFNPQVQIEGNSSLVVRGRNQSVNDPPLAKVENFAADPEVSKPPTIDQAYTPFQLYRINEGSVSLAFLLPSLPSPKKAK